MDATRGMAAVLCALAMMAAIFVAAPTAGAQPQDDRPPTHVVSGNENTSVHHTAVIDDAGNLVTDFFAPGTGIESAPVTHDEYSNWRSVDLASSSLLMLLVATTDEGQLLTKLGYMDLGSTTPTTLWGEWFEHGQASWSTDAAPSVAFHWGYNVAQESVIYGALAAVKADGRMYTRSMAMMPEADLAQSWGSWKLHGRPDWARVDIASQAGPFDDGSSGVERMWLLGVKKDGRLYLRSSAGPNNDAWGPWRQQGKPTWSPDAEPVIVSDRWRPASYAAIKADGRLYTRVHMSDVFNEHPGWEPFERHGSANWSGVDIASTDGTLAILGVKENGELYYGVTAAFQERAWVRLGAGAWDTSEPSIAATESFSSSAISFLAAKQDGRRFGRQLTPFGWLAWATFVGAP